MPDEENLEEIMNELDADEELIGELANVWETVEGPALDAAIAREKTARHKREKGK